MNTKRLLAAASISLALAQPALADDAGLSKQYGKCMDKSGGTTTSMIDCIGAELKLQDARLNKAYKEHGASLSAERKKQLVEVQRLWLKFRDANCAYYADPDGGTLARVNANACVLNMTAARARELEDFQQP